jgi:hypothetical protein
LEELDDDEACVRFTPRALTIYDHASHLKQQITFDDFRSLLEVAWLDRVWNAGWNLQLMLRVRQTTGSPGQYAGKAKVTGSHGNVHRNPVWV